MLAAFIVNEARATEPIIPLSLFRNSIIAVCSLCSFLLGAGMFGAVIYLPLFMQGVLGTSATQSGNLLTPLLIGAVVGAIIGGQTVSRTGEYKALGIAGSILLAAGMVLFARMTAETTHGYVVWSMVVAGLGMGLLQPVYTIAVQNVAPRERMGTATSSAIFFRSIGSTVGVAAFGSVMLTRYHDEFLRLAPAGLPAEAMPYLTNPDPARAVATGARGNFHEDARRIGDGATGHRVGEDGAPPRSATGVLLRRHPDGRRGLPHLFLKREPLRSRVAPPTHRPPPTNDGVGGTCSARCGQGPYVTFDPSRWRPPPEKHR